MIFGVLFWSVSRDAPALPDEKQSEEGRAPVRQLSTAPADESANDRIDADVTPPREQEPVTEVTPLERKEPPSYVAPELDAPQQVESVGPSSAPDAVREVQQRLNDVIAAGLAVDGMFGPATTATIRQFQLDNNLEPTGVVDANTRFVLWSLPALVEQSAVTLTGPCKVVMVGDSLMAWAAQIHVDALADEGCSALVDAEGGRSLSYGWQCRILRENGSRPLLLVDAPEPGNETCSPSGLELVQQWQNSGQLTGVLVVALGTNDSGLYGLSTWEKHWQAALDANAGRPVVFVTAAGKPGTNQEQRQARYSEELTSWCQTRPACVIADWATTPTAQAAASYSDDVHLTSSATKQRATYLAAAARSVVALNVD